MSISASESFRQQDLEQQKAAYRKVPENLRDLVENATVSQFKPLRETSMVICEYKHTLVLGGALYPHNNK